MKLICGDCGNEGVFITEKLFAHWVKIDLYGMVTSVDHLQKSSREGEDIHGAHLECGECNSSNVRDEE